MQKLYPCKWFYIKVLFNFVNDSKQILNKKLGTAIFELQLVTFDIKVAPLFL